MDDLGRRLKEAVAERYAIEGMAGQGGMATVYRATDRKHSRAVAIKVLRPELAATIGGERFLREIELSARLQHPHIIPLYDSGEAAGILYYVMPFIEGESLRNRLTREGKLPFEEAVRLTREVASALAYAHEHGVVHRDIKPENIMLSGGHAVVADFGIARALTAAKATRGTQMTEAGLAIGTPTYMSPEQATASTVDARTDQYSLGCVLYEMVTGKPPFTGATAPAVLTQSLSGPRPKLSKVERATPAEADGVLTRALAADPAKRFDSVQAFAAALEHAAGGGSGALAERRRLQRIAIGLPLGVALLAALWIWFGPRHNGPVVAGAESIAVMPFSTSGPGVDLMGEGMVDLLSTNLNAVGGIHAVEPRTVINRLKKAGLGPGLDLETALGVARSVNAQAALMGSIVATGPRVRLSADLYGPARTSLAHAQVDGASDSVLTLVDQLSLALVREIWRSKEPVPSLRLGALTTTSLAAMREYLVGEQRYRRSEWDSASAAFTRAIEQDSTFALAHYRLAMALGWKGGYTLPRARQASEAALRFASRLQPRERALVTAYQLFSYGKLAAVDSMRRYVAAYPGDIEGWYLLGETQYHTNQLTGLDPAALEAPFDRVIAADSTLTPALIHPLELALAYRDSTRYARYIDLLKGGADPEEYGGFRAAGALVWQNQAPDSAGARLLAANMGATMSTFTAAIDDADATSELVLYRYNLLAQAVLAGQPSEVIKTQMAVGRGLTLASLGRFTEAQRLADSLRPSSLEQAGGIVLFPIMIGFAPPDYGKDLLARFGKAPITNPFQAYLAATVALARGETRRAGQITDSMLARDTAAYPAFLRGLFVAAHGWRQVLAGDTAQGLQDLARGIEMAGGSGGTFLNGPPRLQLALTMAARPDSRKEAILRLKYGFENDLGMLPIIYLALGRAFEAQGDKVGAAEAYTQFLRLWDKADSSAQGRVREAKEGLRRVTAEPR